METRGTTAGFTTGKPWLPLAGNHAGVNVAAQRDDAGSMLPLHRELLALRKKSPALNTGSCVPVTVDAEDVFVYTRFAGDEAYLVTLNLTDVARRFTLPAHIGSSAAGGVDDGPRSLSSR